MIKANRNTKSLVMQVPQVNVMRETLSAMADPIELLEFAKRLNQICDDMAIPPKGQGRQTGLAAKFSVTQRAALKWLEGESYPTIDHARELAQWAGVRFEWLMTGIGDKHYQTTYNDPAIERVVELMKIMEPENRYLAARLVDTIAKPKLKNGTQ
jgi:transcriptional regulator with XRE-family HTH domain